MVVVLTSVAILSAWVPPAWATWSATQEGNTWYVRQGNTQIAMPDQKTAASVADKFNKIDDKADKRAEKANTQDSKGGPSR